MNNLNAIGGIIFLLSLIIGLVWYSVAEYDNYVLPIASEHGYVTERLFWVTTAVTAFVFIVTQIVMFYFAYKYKYNESRKAQFYPENLKLELIWTIIHIQSHIRFHMKIWFHDQILVIVIFQRIVHLQNFLGQDL